MNIIDAKTTFIDKEVKIGKNVTIYPNNHIIGECIIKDNAIIMPNNIIKASIIGEGTTVTASYLDNAVVGQNTTIGPYAYLRPKTIVGNKCRIGDFVEIKNATIDDGSKVSHLTYVGDADIGKNCNIGCGVVFVNYNGVSKNHTSVEDNCFIGSNCNVIAPVKLKKGSYIACGTTITDSIEENSFVIGRARQEEKLDRANAMKEKFRADKGE